MSSFMSQPKGGADVQDALIATQRSPDYSMGKKERVPNNRVNNISQYVANNLKKVAKPRHEEHR